MALVVTGRMNKQIAADLDLSEITVKVHRGNVMHKMGAKSLAELVRMADRLGVYGAPEALSRLYLRYRSPSPSVQPSFPSSRRP